MDTSLPLPPVLDSIRASFLSDISQVVNSGSPFGSLAFRRGVSSGRSSVSLRAKRSGGSLSDDAMARVNLGDTSGTTLVREWETPAKKIVVGEPPGPVSLIIKLIIRS